MDFSTYQPPGVYVDEDPSTLVSVSGVSPTVIAIVGPGLGYRSTTEAISTNGTTVVTLANTGINQATISVTTNDGTVIDPVNYVISSTIPTGGAETDRVTTFAVASSSTINSGDIVYATYQYTDASYYQAARVTDYDVVEGLYGPAIDSVSGLVASPLSFAAKFAFDNGAQTIVLVACVGTATAVTSDNLQAAYSVLDSQYDVSIIVPLPVGIIGTDSDLGDLASVGSDLLTYIENQVDLDLLRIGIVGTDKRVTADPVNLISSYASNRMMHAHPNRMLFFSSLSNASIEVSGFYLAAAYAGMFAALSPQVPLTKKTPRGFSGVPASMAATMTTAKKNSWSDAGIAVTEITRANALSVRHGTSTDRTNTLTREISLVRARDSMVNLIQNTLDSSGIIGGFIDADTSTSVGGLITGVLETCKGLDYIVDYSNVKVRQSSSLPSVIEVKFQYKPAFPLNYVTVTFTVDTSTGDTDTSDLTS